MLLSIIIPTYNRTVLLDKCLINLYYALQNLTKQEIEVIVTEDGDFTSTSNIFSKKYNWIKIIAGPKKGPAANRNNAALNAKGDWLIFIDDDCLPGKGVVDAYKNSITNNSDILAFEGRIFVNSNPSSLLDEAPLNEKGGCFWSCNMAIQKQFFFNIGMFDETFPHAAMEDVDLFYRIKKVTSKYLFIPQASVEHPWRTNYNIVKTSKQRFKSLQYYIKKHPEEKNRLNFSSHFKGFLKTRPATFRLALQCHFKGLRKKLAADIVWIFLGFKLLKK